MTKDHLRLIKDPDSGIQFYKLNVNIGVLTKQHREDSEDLRAGGDILFEENHIYTSTRNIATGLVFCDV